MFALQAMCLCLETSSLSEAMTRCLCADDVRDYLEQGAIVRHTSHGQEPEIEDVVQKWWTDMTSGIQQPSEREGEQLSWDTYELLISR